MANSYTEVTLSAQQQNGFTTPAYIKQEHLKVYVNNVLVDGNTSVFGTLTTTANLTYSFVTTTATSLNFSELLPANTIVRIDRNSSQNARLNDYSDASLLTADVMDQDANQMFFVAQEALDQASKTNLAAGTFYYAQGTAPTSVAVGTVWFNTDSSPNTLQVWCGGTEGWRFVAPVHETTRYTNASGIAFSVNGQPNSGTDAAYAGLAKITDTGFTSSSYFHLNGVKQVSGTLAEVNATPATADYVFDQANSNIWFKPIAAADVIVIESFSGSFSQEVTAKEAAALNHRNDAEKLATYAENAQFILSDGVTANYSAKHFKALAEAARDLALQYKNDTNQLKADTDQLKSDTAQLKADTTQLKADTLQAKTDALQAETDAQTAQGLAESARDTALSHKNLAQEYATKAEDTNITGGTDKSALHYAAKAAASATAAAGSESNAASTLANAVTLNTNQTLTGDKKFGSSANLYIDGGQSIKFGDAAVTTTTVDGTDHTQYPLEILVTDDNSTAYIRENATNNLAIEGQDVSIRDKDGNRRVYTTGGDSAGHVALYYGNNNTPKMTTSGTGVTVNGTVTADGLTLGNNEKIAINSNLEIYTNGNDSYIQEKDASGALFIEGQNFFGRDKDQKNRLNWDNDNVRLYFKNDTASTINAGLATEVTAGESGERLRTQAGGIDVIGTVTTDALDLSGNTTGANDNLVEALKLPTNSKINFNNTFSISHKTYDNPYAYISEVGSGGLRIEGASVSVFTNDGSADGAAFGVQRINASAGASGNVKLYYGNETNFANHKFETTSTGVNVVGTVTADTATFSSGAQGDNLVVATTSDGTSAAPDIVFVKDRSTAPVAEEKLGNILFKAPDGDNNTTNVTYGKIQVEVAAVDASADTYSGQIDFYPQDQTSLTTNNETVSMRVNETRFKVANNTRAVINDNGIDVTGTVSADGLTIDGDSVINGEVDIQNGHRLSFFQTDNSTDGLQIYADGNNNSVITETTADAHLYITGDRILLQESTAATDKRILIGDNDGVKIYGENELRIAVGNGSDGNGNVLDDNISFFTGSSENLRAQITETGMTVNGTVTATSITASQTAEVDTTNKTMANFKGQKVIHTGTTATYEFPDVVAGDVGTTWTVVNAGTGDITIARASGATPNFSKLVTSSNPSSLTGLTLAKGGTIEMVVTAADTITCFGSGF